MENYLEINYDKNLKMLLQAFSYCEVNLKHEEIINELLGDNDLKKQLCLIELNILISQAEADILVSNLINQSGPIRETASFKILEFIKDEKYRHLFQKREILDIFVKGITDINPSVSRNVVEIITCVDDWEYLYNSILSEIKMTLSKFDDMKQERSYVTNKKNFNLYWNLEAIVSISSKLKPDNLLLEILTQTALSNDYTIREKTAKTANVLSKNNIAFMKVLNILKDDDNIYVLKYV